jgi:hypothetical protein
VRGDAREGGCAGRGAKKTGAGPVTRRSRAGDTCIGRYFVNRGHSSAKAVCRRVRSRAASRETVSRDG